MVIQSFPLERKHIIYCSVYINDDAYMYVIWIDFKDGIIT